VSRLAHARIVTFMAVLLVGRAGRGRARSAQGWARRAGRRARRASSSCRQAAADFVLELRNRLPPSPRQALDCAFLQHTIAATLASGGHSVQLLFAFEYVILASSIIAAAAKYVMSMVDSAMEGRWEGKVCVFRGCGGVKGWGY
jgi:hypothetical protein